MSKIDLYHGDCIDILKDIPDESVDMILTDPPYGMEYVSNRRKEKYEKIINDNNLHWIDDFCHQSYRIAKENTAHYVFCSFHNIDIFKKSLEKNFKIKNLLVWNKNNHGSGDLYTDFAPKTEFIWFVQKGSCNMRGKREPNIFKFNKTNNEHHPTEKPVVMMEYLIKKFSDEQDTIMDPFMGSGTTGVACKNTKRNFIGIEKDSNYFNIATKRINETNRLSEMFE